MAESSPIEPFVSIIKAGDTSVYTVPSPNYQKYQKIAVNISVMEELYEEDRETTIENGSRALLFNCYIYRCREYIDLLMPELCTRQSQKYGKTLHWVRFTAQSKVQIGHLHIGEKIQSASTHHELEKAKNLAAYKLSRKLSSNDKVFFTPRNLIGLPNIRGHCYMIPVFVPLFSQWEFNRLLYYAYHKLGSQGLLQRVPNKDDKAIIQTNFPLFEALYHLLCTYFKAARGKGIVKGISPAIMVKRARGEGSNQCSFSSGGDMEIEKPKNSSQSYKCDSAMMRIARILGRGTDNYLTPGMDSTHLFYDLFNVSFCNNGSNVTIGNDR